MGEEMEIWKIKQCARQAADGTGAANLKRALGCAQGPDGSKVAHRKT